MPSGRVINIKILFSFSREVRLELAPRRCCTDRRSALRQLLWTWEFSVVEEDGFGEGREGLVTEIEELKQKLMGKGQWRGLRRGQEDEGPNSSHGSTIHELKIKLEQVF